MSLVFAHQIEAAEKSVSELETELLRHRRRATRGFHSEDLVQSEITLFDDIKKSVARWQSCALSDREDGADKFWLPLYRRLEVVFEKTAAMMAEVEKEGVSVSGKVEFLMAWRDLRAIVCFNHDRIAKSVEQVSRGELVPLNGGERELRGRADD
jgi:hypothetical protein